VTVTADISATATVQAAIWEVAATAWAAHTPEPSIEFIRFTFQECAGVPGLDEQVCQTLLRTFELYLQFGPPQPEPVGVGY
jgi:hypothetical protein